MTESDARQIAEMYLSRYNPTYWDGSGEVPSEANFDICRVAVDSMYEGCTLEIQLCKPDACPCYAASIHLFEGGFWTGFGVGSFNKTALCYDIGSASALASAIMRICATYENLTNFRKVFVERLVISKERMNEINQYTDEGKKQDEIEFESVTFADGMCMDVRCIPRKNGPSWCEAAIYDADEDVVTSEPYKRLQYCAHCHQSKWANISGRLSSSLDTGLRNDFHQRSSDTGRSREQSQNRQIPCRELQGLRPRDHSAEAHLPYSKQ